MFIQKNPELEKLEPIELARMHVAMQKIMNAQLSTSDRQLDVLSCDEDRYVIFVVLHLLSQQQLKTLYSFMQKIPVVMNDEEQNGFPISLLYNGEELKRLMIRFLDDVPIPSAVRQSFSGLSIPVFRDLRDTISKHVRGKGA